MSTIERLKAEIKEFTAEELTELAHWRYRGSLESSSGCLWRPASLTICLISMPIIRAR